MLPKVSEKYEDIDVMYSECLAGIRPRPTFSAKRLDMHRQGQMSAGDCH